MGYKRSTLMQERMQQNREKILLSAKELIAGGGFKEAQVQAIAERAGVSSGLVYRYFENKNRILTEVLSAAISREISILNKIAAGDLSATAKLEKVVTTFVKRALNSPQLAYSLMFEPIDTEIEYERFRSKQLIKDCVKDVLNQGKASKEFTFEDLNTTALCIVGAITLVVIEPLNTSQHATFVTTHHDDFIRQIADFCVKAVVDNSAK
jgi:AcrR family transcriptional regulator